jgi:hypothetical protein
MMKQQQAESRCTTVQTKENMKNLKQHGQINFQVSPGSAVPRGDFNLSHALRDRIADESSLRYVLNIHNSAMLPTPCLLCQRWYHGRDGKQKVRPAPLRQWSKVPIYPRPRNLDTKDTRVNANQSADS